MLIFFFLIIFNLTSNAQDYLKVQAKEGDGLITLFQRYDLEYSEANLSSFKEINKTNSLSLQLKKDYFLPIQIYKYNGKSIRSSIKNNNYNYAYAIQLYNEGLTKKKITEQDFRISKEIWIPVNFQITKATEDDKVVKKEEKTPKIRKPEEKTHPIFGKANEKVQEVDLLLDKCAFYLVSGHGGPDPGAQSQKDGYTLSEDEYAYDVILRLGRELIKHGAEVFFIVQDPNDGIRDEVYLANSKDEIYIDGSKIVVDQRQRLKDRSEAVNRLYNTNPAKKKHHHAISIHVDSRISNEKQIDIFFYHSANSSEGELIANSLLSTIKSKYEESQPGRGYEGSVSHRNLYVLRHFIPVTTFIELGNIQNFRDQQRILVANNRQAIANWLCDGIIEYYKTK